MVRVKAPLMSLSASGTVGKSITFSNWKGRDYVRRHAIPANPKSGLQVGVRSVFGFLTKDFTNLSAGDISDWEDLAAAENLTALNAQIRDGVDRGRRNLGWRENTTDVDPAQVDAAQTMTLTAQPKTIIVSWTDAAANKPDYCWAIYRSLTTGFTPDISNLVGIVKYGLLSFTDKGLTTGVEYFYRLRGLSTSGFLGSLIAEDSEVAG